MISPTMSGTQPVDSGYWRIIVDPRPSSSTNEAVDVTFVRGAATTVANLSTMDPFGPSTATIVFTSVTLLDRPGTGDLSWLVPEANVDICWMKPQVFGVKQTEADVVYRWEGYFVSFEYGEDDAGGTLTVACNGAMKQMDNYLAYPEHLTQPISYEYAIERQFNTVNRPDSRLRDCIPFKETAVSDPDFAFLGDNPNNIFRSSDYTNYNSKDAIYNKTMSSYYKPINLQTGDLWTGLLTRSTGNFEPVLTNYIQNLLESMQTPTGSFTLLLGSGRQPYFKHRKRLIVPNDETLVVDVLWPGVKISVTQDFSQKVNVVYGSGKAMNGDTFTNIVYDADGSRSRYEPFAYKQENYPRVKSNGSFNSDKMSKEVSLNFWAGLNTADAKLVAEKHLELFSDPGITAQLTLNVDPQLMDGTGVARQTLTAGRSILVKGLFGNRQGILFHITEHSYSGAENTVSLTLDSKSRSQLTVQEVRQRGKDSLVVSRLLGVGQFKPNIDDMLFPWSYEQGSGFVPLGSKFLWDIANRNNISIGDFPWSNLTTAYPPKHFNAAAKADASTHYVGIPGAADTENADNNWSAVAPVMFSAVGTISSVRFVAVKADGTPYKVPFHVSLWMEDAAGGLSFYTTPALTSPENFGVQLRKATIKAVNQSGAGLSATVTTSKTVNTGAAKDTITATLKFSAKDASYIFDRISSAGKIQVRDMKNVSNSANTWFTVKSYDADNRTITFNIAKSLCKSFNKQVNQTETVKNIWIVGNYAPSASDAGIVPAAFNYKWGQHYPLYQRAWERIEPEGNNAGPLAYYGPNSPIAGWGTYYEMAGFYPNNGGIEQYSPATGLFADDTPFTYDFTAGNQTSAIDTNHTPTANTLPSTDGSYSNEGKKHATGYAMFYCDQEYDDATGTLVPRKQSVYFIGRLYRQNPGSS
jgi:hypothetical protein